MDFIKIGDKEHPYKLSYRAIKNISALSKDGKLGIDSVEHALYWGLYSGWSITKNAVEFPFTLEQVVDILDEHFELFSKVQEDIKELTEKISGEGKQKPLEKPEAQLSTTGTGQNGSPLEN